ncbi:hypothetical protein QOT17_003055 [Balamuthia mandrillaris]
MADEVTPAQEREIKATLNQVKTTARQQGDSLMKLAEGPKERIVVRNVQQVATTKLEKMILEKEFGYQPESK